MERLDKVLAATGRWSRREVKQLVRQGQVRVNGAAAASAEEKVEPETAVITVGGEPVRLQKYTYVMLHKPAGVLTATEDSRQRTVLDLLPPELRKRGLSPVGRLDKDTTGLLLLTTDGELNHRLLAPARHVDKTYLATLDKPVGDKEVAAFASGLSLSDFEAAPADLTPLPDNQARVTIHEGKFHQVKRMFEAVEPFGSLVLDEALPCGQWRELTEAEASALYRDAQMEEKHG